MNKLFPILQWLPSYSKGQLLRDLPAGLVVGIMLIPQSMAYAMLAGLNPVYGLYAAIIPLLVYAAFGTSRHLAVGPVAILSLLTFTVLSPLAEPGSSEYVAYAVMLAFLAGVIQLALGLLKAGFIVKFLSHAVIKGFTAAAAIVIGVSQLKYLLGVSLVSHSNPIVILFDAFTKLSHTQWLTLLIGLAAITTLVLCRKHAPRFPVHIVLVGLGISIVYAFKLDALGVTVIGDVPKGFPTAALPELQLEVIIKLLPMALTIAMIGYMESIAIARTIASKEKYKIYPNQELLGLGLANVIGSLFSAYPVTGSFSRTAVNYQAGARTGMAAMITAGCVLTAILFLTPLLYYLPHAILAAIVMVAVYSLIDVKGAVNLFRIKPADGWTLVVTFAACLLISIELGLMIGIGFSLALFIVRSAYPNAVELGYLARRDVFKSVNRYPRVKQYPNMLILRIDAPLYFANMGFLEETLERMARNKPKLKWIIMDFSGVNDMDAVALHDLDDLMEHYRQEGIGFMLAGVKGHVYSLMAQAGWAEKYGEAIAYMSIQEAVQAALEQDSSKGQEYIYYI